MALVVASCAKSELCNEGACEQRDAAVTGGATSYSPSTSGSSDVETPSSPGSESTGALRDGGLPSSSTSGVWNSTSGEATSGSTCDGAECAECVVENNAGCGEERPFCIATEASDGGVESAGNKARCVQCVEDFDCQISGAGELCEEHECLPCEPGTHRGCGGERPYCVGSDPSSAPDADASVGDVGEVSATEGPRCAECLTEADCGGATPACVEHACVACDRDAQCTEPGASVCDLDSNTCIPCRAAGECTHLAGTPACDVEGGRCVECTREESEACGSRVCNVLVESEGYQRCSAFDEGETIQCTECVNDAQCAEGFRCVPETYKVPSSDAGVAETGKHYCMRLEASLGGPSCSPSNRPFVGSFEATSEGDEVGRYCRPQYTTCAAYLMHANAPDVIPEGQPGAGQATCFGHESCGLVDVDDGYCVVADPNTTPPTNRCTYECASDLDCNALPGAVRCVTATTWDGEQRKVCSVTSNN